MSCILKRRKISTKTVTKYNQFSNSYCSCKAKKTSSWGKRQPSLCRFSCNWRWARPKGDGSWQTDKVLKITKIIWSWLAESLKEMWQIAFDMLKTRPFRVWSGRSMDYELVYASWYFFTFFSQKLNFSFVVGKVHMPYGWSSNKDIFHGFLHWDTSYHIRILLGILHTDLLEHDAHIGINELNFACNFNIVLEFNSHVAVLID